MRQWLAALSLVLAGCGGGNPENSAVCGFASVAGASMVLQQMGNTAKALTEAPASLSGVVPARVAGHGTARALASRGPDGAVLGYEGDGFPPIGGFGLVLVDDSSEVVRGVLVYEVDPPPGYPMIGAISDQRLTLPLHGLRVHWASVTDPRCPLFGAVDTTRR